MQVLWARQDPEPPPVRHKSNDYAEKSPIQLPIQPPWTPHLVPQLLVLPAHAIGSHHLLSLDVCLATISVKDGATNIYDADADVPVSVALSVIEEGNEYDVPASPPLAYGPASSIISFVNEALARAPRFADVPSVAAWMANGMADEAGNDELAMKVEAYLSHVCLREYRKPQSESKYIQTTSLFVSLFNLGAISSMYLLYVAETLVFTIDFPMRTQGVVVLFASAGSRLCRAEDVARSTHVAVKFGEASNARPRNELLSRYSIEIKSLVDEWTKVEEYKALWG